MSFFLEKTPPLRQGTPATAGPERGRRELHMPQNETGSSPVLAKFLVMSCYFSNFLDSGRGAEAANRLRGPTIRSHPPGMGIH
jgi:hypothetical protein